MVFHPVCVPPIYPVSHFAHLYFDPLPHPQGKQHMSMLVAKSLGIYMMIS